MAVFTEISLDEAARLFERLKLGELRTLVGIASGIENTNYFADATQGQYVVTLFERLRRSELPYYLELTQHLARRGLPVPRPHADAQGELVHTLSGKPAAVTDRLPGAPQFEPQPSHCATLGTTLARLHIAAGDYAREQPNPCGLAFWEQNVPWLLPLLPDPTLALLQSELQFQRELAASAEYAALPRGAIHGDLFRDNVLFRAEQLSGLLDFYFAGSDTFVFDIAVCLNDWCSDTDGRLSPDRADALMSAYASVRALNAQEIQLTPALLRAAALRFWITRLCDLHRPRHASLLQPHDPAQFERILRQRLAEPWRP